MTILELVSLTGEIISTHELIQDTLRTTRFYVTSLICPNKDFQIRVNGQSDILGLTYQRFNKLTYSAEPFLASTYLSAVRDQTYTVNMDFKNYDSKKLKLLINVKTCDDFKLNLFYMNLKLTIDEYDSHSDVIVLTASNNQIKKCSVEIVFKDQFSSEEYFSKIVDMNEIL